MTFDTLNQIPIPDPSEQKRNHYEDYERNEEFAKSHSEQRRNHHKDHERHEEYAKSLSEVKQNR